MEQNPNYQIEFPFYVYLKARSKDNCILAAHEHIRQVQHACACQKSKPTTVRDKTLVGGLMLTMD